MSGSALVSNLVVFGRVLRDTGVDVHPGRMPDAVSAIEMVGIRTRADLQATLRTLLVHRREDLPAFNTAFEAFFRPAAQDGGGRPLFSLGEQPRVVAKRVAGSDVGLEIESVDPGSAAPARFAVGAYSAVDVSRTKDFADFSDEEMRCAEALLADLGRQLGTRRARRWQRATTGVLDLRRVVRRSVQSAGELVELPRRQRQEKPRPVVAICDVSGSMERYSRMLLQLVFGLAGGSSSAECFMFATRLTRITRQLRTERGKRAASARLTSLARAVRDWGGGTRIGDALRAFNVGWSRRVMRHGPVVVIVSDGWDRGDPEMLRREILRLRRRCHRLVWLNPLLGSASYEPLTRGMRAALDLVDDFLPAHNLASLEQLVARLATSTARASWKSRAAIRSTHR